MEYLQVYSLQISTNPHHFHTGICVHLSFVGRAGLPESSFEENLQDSCFAGNAIIIIKEN